MKHFRFLALITAGILSCSVPLGALGSELTAEEAVQDEAAVDADASEAAPVTDEAEEGTADPQEETAEEEEAAAASGYCGDDLTWEFTDGALYIKGTGAMYDYDQENVPEWDIYKEEITALYIEEGISLLDPDAFGGLSSLEDVYFEGSEAVWDALEYSESEEDGEAFNEEVELHFEKADPEIEGSRLAAAPAVAPAIVEEPEDQSVVPGKTVRFHVGADRTGVSYRWQWSKNGTTWTDCTSAGSTTDTFSFTMKASYSGRYYRCIVYDDSGEAASRAARITAASEEALEITEQPRDVSAAAGETVSLHVKANIEGASYQWQYSKNGTAWTSCTSGGYNTDTFEFTMKAALSGRSYRCIVTYGSEEVISRAAGISLASTGLKITEQPRSVSAGAGETVSLHVKANIEGASYQWQYSKNGTSWTDCTSGGARTDTFSFVMKAAVAGRTYRCIVTYGNETATSDGAVISFSDALKLVEEPQDVSAAAGETVSLHAKANLTGASYQWQYSKNGTSWTDCTSGGARTDTFSFVMKAAVDGRTYRCIASLGSESVTSRGALITLAGQLVITEQPQDVEAAAGDTVTLHTAANMTGVSYQWQYSKNGTTWTNCTSGGYKTDTFSFTMKEGVNGRSYRCAVTYGSQTVYTEGARITLHIETEKVIDGVVYELTGDVMTVTGYRGSAESVAVRETVDGHTVTVIGESAFEGNTTIRQIDLPDTIQVIKKRAFAGCTSLAEMN